MRGRRGLLWTVATEHTLTISLDGKSFSWDYAVRQGKKNADGMKKGLRKKTQLDDDNMRAEYDFSGGARGKHHQTLQAGYTITIHQPDGEAVVKKVKLREDTIVLAPDVREYFPTRNQ